ncbi:MAG: transposase [Bacteroidetes bacterium]|nr:transposase [Bacteroidota bacterium]MBK8144289.1 transposase [Bacteroidota bacterium]MBP6314248.1 transposase [Chitinophagaceae bacterium]
MNVFDKRQGQMYQEIPYFYTDTIHNFEHLLLDDDLKMVVVQSLKYFVSKRIVKVFAFVIMPNHIHLIWKFLKLNGKESPAGSFTKFTAHKFREFLLEHKDPRLRNFIVEKIDRKMQFWKRDPLAIPLTSEENLIQKLEYIHHNPIKEKWKLAVLPEEYRWSSASFYKNGYDEFGFLSHFRE